MIQKGYAGLHPPRVHVKLGKEDRQQIARMLNKGRESARVLRRALILRSSIRGRRRHRLARSVGAAPKTARAIARRYEEEGLEQTLRAPVLNLGILWDSNDFASV